MQPPLPLCSSPNGEVRLFIDQWYNPVWPWCIVTSRGRKAVDTLLSWRQRKHRSGARNYPPMGHLVISEVTTSQPAGGRESQPLITHDTKPEESRCTGEELPAKRANGTPLLRLRRKRRRRRRFRAWRPQHSCFPGPNHTACLKNPF